MKTRRHERRRDAIIQVLHQRSDCRRLPQLRCSGAVGALPAPTQGILLRTLLLDLLQPQGGMQLTTPRYALSNWNDRHECFRTRELKRLNWVSQPVSLDRERLVLAGPDGIQDLAVLHVLPLVAANGVPRGDLVDDFGRPHTPGTLSAITGIPKEILSAAIDRFLEMGILTIVKPKRNRMKSVASCKVDAPSMNSRCEVDATQHQSESSQDTTSQTEHQSQENHFEKDQQPDGDDAARLNSWYYKQTGKPISVDLLLKIGQNLHRYGGNLAEFSEEMQGHHGPFRRIDAFLFDFSKTFRLKTTRLETSRSPDCNAPMEWQILR